MNFRYLITGILLASCCAMYLLYKNIINQQHQKIKPYIVCTTTLIGDIVQQITQNNIDIHIIMGPGVDPHTYKPIEQDLLKIARADLVMYHGLHLEARMADLFDHLSAIKSTLAVTKDIPKTELIKADDNCEIYDPHVWFDPNLWIIVIETTLKKLVQQFPEYQAIYTHNAHVLIHKIQQAFKATEQQIARIKPDQRVLITSHDAFEYFARAYNFKVLSLQGINTTSEAGITDMQNIARIIIEQRIPTIFVESSIPPRSMQALKQRVTSQKGSVKIGKELYSDSLGNSDSDASTYVDMINYNIDTIVAGLEK